jgi:hypothetical protein
VRGNWRPNNGHHSARHNFTVTIQESGHAITRGLKTNFVEANEGARGRMAAATESKVQNELGRLHYRQTLPI